MKTEVYFDKHGSERPLVTCNSDIGHLLKLVETYVSAVTSCGLDS